jgi:hypothetical protein
MVLILFLKLINLSIHSKILFKTVLVGAEPVLNTSSEEISSEKKMKQGLGNIDVGRALSD